MRKAVSLVELVFAIVVIGITAMSFPLILTQTSNNIKMALQQEAILNTKSLTGIILSYPWDNNSISDVAVAGEKFMVLDTTGSDADDSFDTLPASNKRIGHIDGSKRRAILTDILGNKVKPTDDTGTGEWGNSDLDDIDDFDGHKESLSVAMDTLDFILDFELESNVVYVSDNLPTGGGNYLDNKTIKFEFTTTSSGTTNIKMIEVTAQNSTRDINITLRAYSSNIGEYDLLDKGSW